MLSKALGEHGPQVSAIGLGCMGMSQFYEPRDGPRDAAESIATIRLAYDQGVTLFDTADMYGPYANERLLGKAVAPIREHVRIATKFGNLKNGAGEIVGVNGHPEYVRQACDGSLRRLGLDVIDVYLQHRVDRHTPIEETWGALSELVAEGKVRWLGICEAAVQTIRRAHAVHPVAAVQTELSIFSREPCRELLPALAELGIGFMAYAPLSRGLLSGVIATRSDLADGDWRRGLPRFADGAIEANAGLASRLGEVARRRGISLAQLAMSWVLAQGDIVIAVMGTTRRRHLAENLRSADITLSGSDLAEIGRLLAEADVRGDRYPDMSHVDA
jgi:aryl-alcohol dehydrogenase-like predicted oxidoreductase